MRYGCAAFLMLSAVMASAQDRVTELTQTLEARANALAGLAQKLEVRVSTDEVVARLMSFDRNGDRKVATAELSERMQVLVTRGDTGGDGSLDDLEIRALALRRLEFVPTAQRNLQFGGYSFGDTVGLSSRTHILNTITDLRLASAANDEARRVASTFADELEGTALANLRRTVAPMLTEEQLCEFERNIKAQGGRTFRTSSCAVTEVFVAAVSSPVVLLAQYTLNPEQMKIAAAAVETFKTDQQLDDVRRSALVAQLEGVLTGEERDNFRAALARRPVVQAPGVIGGVVGGIAAKATTQSAPR